MLKAVQSLAFSSRKPATSITDTEAGTPFAPRKSAVGFGGKRITFFQTRTNDRISHSCGFRVGRVAVCGSDGQFRPPFPQIFMGR